MSGIHISSSSSSSSSVAVRPFSILENKWLVKHLFKFLEPFSYATVERVSKCWNLMSCDHLRWKAFCLLKYNETGGYPGLDLAITRALKMENPSWKAIFRHYIAPEEILFRSLKHPTIVTPFSDNTHVMKMQHDTCFQNGSFYFMSIPTAKIVRCVENTAIASLAVKKGKYNIFPSLREHELILYRAGRYLSFFDLRTNTTTLQLDFSNSIITACKMALVVFRGMKQLFLFVGTLNNMCLMFNLRGERVAIFRGHATHALFGIFGIHVYRNQLFTTCLDSTTKRWDIETQQCLTTYKTNMPQAFLYIFEDHFYTTGEKGQIFKWKIRRNDLVTRNYPDAEIQVGGLEAKKRVQARDLYHSYSTSKDIPVTHFPQQNSFISYLTGSGKLLLYTTYDGVWGIINCNTMMHLRKGHSTSLDIMQPLESFVSINFCPLTQTLATTTFHGKVDFIQFKSQAKKPVKPSDPLSLDIIRTHCFEFLDMRSLARCELVSREWRDDIRHLLFSKSQLEEQAYTGLSTDFHKYLKLEESAAQIFRAPLMLFSDKESGTTKSESPLLKLMAIASGPNKFLAYDQILYKSTPTVFLAGERGLLQHWSMNGEKLGDFIGHTSDVNGVKSAYNHLFSVSSDCTAKRWDIATRVCLATYRATTRLSSLYIFENHLYAGGSNGKIIFWNLLVEPKTATSQVIKAGGGDRGYNLLKRLGQVTPHGMHALMPDVSPTAITSFAGIGRLLFYSTSDGVLGLYDLRGKQFLLRDEMPTVAANAPRIDPIMHIDYCTREHALFAFTKSGESFVLGPSSLFSDQKGEMLPVGKK